MNRNTQQILLFAVIVAVLLFFLLKPSDNAPIEKIVTQVDTVRVVDTLRIVVKDSVYIKEYVPIIIDSVAVLDTTIKIETDSIKIHTDLGIKFDLKDYKFKDISLGFSNIVIPYDTIYIRESKTVFKMKKVNSFKYVEAGIIGGAVTLIAYALIRGF